MEKPPLFSPSPEKKPKASGVDRIVGVDEEHEESLLHFFGKKFTSEKSGLLQKESSPELKRIFEEVNVRLWDFLSRYGAKSLDIPFSSIVLIDRSKMTPEQIEDIQKSKMLAEFRGRLQKIIIWSDFDSLPQLQRYALVVHEIVHMYSFQSWHHLPEHQKSQPSECHLTSADGSETMDIDRRRIGFHIYGKHGNSYFDDINEAITEELTLRFDLECFKDFPALNRDLHYRGMFVKAEADRLGVSEDSVIRNFMAVSERARDTGGIAFKLHPGAYLKERTQFRRLISELYEKNQDSFESQEAIFEEFARAAMTGRILPIARLIEKTYGKGSFRLLGKETNKPRQANVDQEPSTEEKGVGGGAEGV